MGLPTMRFVMVAAAGILLAAGAGRLSAEPVPERDEQQVRSVIVSQLQAFAADDADGAFETTTPDVRAAIGNAWHFLAMVRGAYPMVYHPASITFMQPELREGGALQLAEIVDLQGKSWLVLFALERQPDATWRISGCVVAENRWVPT